MNQRILITGGSGLLGSYLVRWFRQKGFSNITSTYQHSPEAIPADIREGVEWRKLSLPDLEETLEIVQGQEWVIHSAALVSYQKKDKYRMLEINQTGTEHIVNACITHNVGHLVYIGSIGALGREANRVTLTENNPWLQNSFSTAYGLSKYLGELEVWRGAGEGLKVSVLLPSVILGTGDWQRSSLRIVDRVVHKLPLYPGGQTGYVDVRDVVVFADHLLTKSITGERWIINGSNVPYKVLYEKLSMHLGLVKKFRLAPKWLAKIILMGGNLVNGKSLGIDVINQVYGTFIYDSSKSLTVDGFRYHDIDQTLKEIAEAYKNASNEALNFK